MVKNTINSCGCVGSSGPQGNPGTNGLNATMSIGSVTTGAPGSYAMVTNTGTSTNAIWNYTIPRGDTGSAAPSSDYAFMDILMSTNNFGLGNMVIQNSAGIQTLRKNTGQAIGDLITSPFTLPDGIYTLGVFGARVSNSGIWRFSIDGVGVTYDIDMYAPTTTQLIAFPGPFTITAGKHFLHTVCIGSTPGGSNFYGYFAGFRLM